MNKNEFEKLLNTFSNVLKAADAKKSIKLVIPFLNGDPFFQDYDKSGCTILDTAIEQYYNNSKQ